MTIEKIISVKDLKEKRKTLFKKDSKQIVIFNVNDNIFAIDNRCPHEGYPLDHGSFNDSCILTCNWHNWKFDLKDGKCLTGGDNVKTYKTFIEDDYLYLDLSEPSKESIQEEILLGFNQAFLDRQYARISRELSRLYYNKIDPIIAFEKAILWSYDKLEGGTTHAYAAGADWLKLYLEADNIEDKIIYLTEAIDYISLDSLRHKSYPYTENKREWDYQQFIQAIENEDENTAIELINGAFVSGLGFKDIEEALVEVTLAHYNDFGHSLIYLQKTAYLIEKLGINVEKELSQALTRSIIQATREDLLPEFKEYSTYLKAYGELNENINDSFFLKNVNKSMKLTVDLFKNQSNQQIYEKLLESNVKNFLYFDINYQYKFDNKVTENIGWLDFTHALTFANAVNEICNKYPELWKKALLQMACFNGRNIGFLDQNIDTEAYKVENYQDFKVKVIGNLTDHAIPTPIFPAHILKTSVAVFKEYEKTDNLELKNYLLISLNRFINSPIKQKHIRRTIKQSIKLVSRDF